jgi:hypothetical protein
MILPTAVATWHRALTHQVPWGWTDVMRDSRQEQPIGNRVPKTKVFFDEILRHDQLTGAEVCAIRKKSGAAQNQELFNGMIRNGLIEAEYRPHGEHHRIVSVRVLRRVDYFDYVKTSKRRPLIERQRHLIKKAKLKAIRLGETFTRKDLDLPTPELKGHYICKLVNVGVAVNIGNRQRGVYKALVDVAGLIYGG